MKCPSIADLETAAEWLSHNEGDNGESEACARVAEWLTQYARANQERAAARQVGCSVDQFRQRLARLTT